MADKKTTKELLAKAKQSLAKAKNAKGVEAIFVEYLGKRGAFKEKLRSLKNLPSNERAAQGKILHNAIEDFQQALDKKSLDLKATEKSAAINKKFFDITLPSEKIPRGRLHPLTLVRRRAETIFMSMGFSIAEGPEVEDEWHNFDALNIPKDHPARDLWDTFWIKSKIKNQKSKLLLRTHTSPVQIRYMIENLPPFKIIVPGEAYRHEATDASHEAQFMQLEGLMVDYKNSLTPVTMSTLVLVLKVFFEKFFKQSVALRIRPSFFPFVEPGIETDLSCVICGGKGCSVCGQSGWLEMGGAGMVHPKVFEAVGYNPSEVQGFAFGYGLDRLAMLLYKIPDIRFLRSGGEKFLKQFNKL